MAKKILLVDDEYLQVRGLQSNLQDAYAQQGKDHRVEIAVGVSGPHGAIEKIRAGLAKTPPENYDVIITDYGMPPTNGVAMIKEVRKIPGYDKTPVILRSGNALEEIRRLHPHAIDHLGVEYCSKDEPVAKVLGMVEAALAKPQRGREE